MEARTILTCVQVKTVIMVSPAGSNLRSFFQQNEINSFLSQTAAAANPAALPPMIRE